MKARELFDELVELDVEGREARLAQIGDEHASVVAKVRRLLAANDSTASFLETGTAGDLFESIDDDIRRRIGDYRVGDILGQGGMGIVYRAEQDHPRRTVALKVLPASRLSGEALARFENEAHALARLRHPAITQVYDAGSEDSPDGYVHFIAMELVDGRTLTRWAETAPPLGARFELVAAVADGLHHAHEQGVIHRDVKPSNILVRGDGTPKILDFGVARLADRDHTLTRAGQVVGTLAYMSPEQASSGEDVDTRSDQYSLGVVAYELLTGHLPVDVSGCSLTDAAMRVRERQPLPPTRHDGRLRRDVDVVLGKALAKERGERYPSLAEFAADLRRLASREPIAARPPTLLESVARVARRHRVAALAAAAATIFLVGASVLLTTQNRALSKAREDLGHSLTEEAAARALADERGEELAGKIDDLARNNAELERALTAARRAEEQATEARDEAERNAEQAAAQMLVFERWLKGGAGQAKVPTPQTTLLEATRELAASAGRITTTGFPAAFAYLTIAELCSLMGLREEARANLQRALENTRGRARNDVERTQALVIRQTHAVHLHNDGDTAAAIRVLERSLDIVERLDGEVADLWELRINSFLASWLTDEGREDEAREVLADVEQLYDETDGDMRSEVAARMRIALAHSDLGDWDTASRRMLEIVEVTRGKIEVASQRRHALAQAAAIELAQGRVEVAERLARESVEACRSGATSNQRANAHFVLGGVLARQDKHGEAIREFSRALELKTADPVRGAEFLSHRSRSQHGAGHGKRAVADATRALRVLDERGQRGRLLDLALDSLVVAAVDTEPDTALEAAERLCHIRRQADPGSPATFEAELHRVDALRRLTRVEDALEVLQGLDEAAIKVGAGEPELLKRYRSLVDALAEER